MRSRHVPFGSSRKCERLVGTSYVCAVRACTDHGRCRICGSGRTAACPSRPAAFAQAAPTAPYSNGDTFEYSITYKITVSQPSSTPAAGNANLTDSETVTYPATYGKKDVYLLTDTENYGPSYPGGYVVKSYYGFVAEHSERALLEYGYRWEDIYESSVVGNFVQMNDKPYSIAAEYPESAGLGWSDNFGYKSSGWDAYSGGSSYREEIEADGAYRSTTQYTGPSSTQTDIDHLTSNSTGKSIVDVNGSESGEWTFGLPFVSRGSEFIPVKRGKTTTDVPDWFPGSGAPLLPLSDTSVKIVAYAGAPGVCRSQAGTYAYDIRMKTRYLDPVGGSYMTDTYDAFDNPSLGLICSVDSETNRLYFNASNGALEETLVYKTIWVLTGEQPSIGTGGHAAPLRFMCLPKRARFPMEFLTRRDWQTSF